MANPRAALSRSVAIAALSMTLALAGTVGPSALLSFSASPALAQLQLGPPPAGPRPGQATPGLPPPPNAQPVPPRPRPSRPATPAPDAQQGPAQGDAPRDRRQALPGETVAPAPDETVIAPPRQKIANPTAVFSGLDKITGRIISFDVAIDETVQFGALQVTPRVCYTRPQTETPQTTTFVEVDEVTLSGEIRRIYSGWMFAASPGLSGVEHAVYDVWLTDCKQTAPVIPGQQQSRPAAQPQAPIAPAPQQQGQPRR